MEKGADSLATLRYIMELSAAHTVYALCGNCDNLAVDFAYGGGELGRDFYRFYLSVWRDRALILQMAAEAGIRVEGPGDLPRLRERLLESCLLYTSLAMKGSSFFTSTASLLQQKLL